MSQVLPPDFDPAAVGDNSNLPKEIRDVLRELVWRRCEEDLLYFLTHFWHIQVIGKGWQLFEPYPYQVDDIAWMQAATKEEKARRIILKARQIGWTTIGGGMAVWDAFFHQHHPWLVAAQTEDDAKDILSLKLFQPWSMLPLWMRERGPVLTDQNSERMTFDNGSTIYSIPATSKAARGKAAFGALLDENAFVEDAEGVLAAVEPMVYGPIFLFSTANGMQGLFFAKWTDSQTAGSEWQARFHPWSAVPARTQKWYEAQKRRYRGQEHLLAQEYPNSPEEAFAKSGRVPFDLQLIRDEQPLCPPLHRYDIQKIDLNDVTMRSLQGSMLYGSDEADFELWVWELPYVERGADGTVVQPPNYVVGCDVAEGLEHGDRTSIWVFDANANDHVASFRGYYPVEELGDLLEWIGLFYHTALMMPERNNQGIAPIAWLGKRHYPRMYRMAHVATRKKGDRTPRYGWWTSSNTKPKMVLDFARALSQMDVTIHDDRFLEEAQAFISDGKGGYSAAEGMHDDHVMGALIAWQGVMEVPKYPIIWTDPEVIRNPTFEELLDIEDSETQLRIGLNQDRPAKNPYVRKSFYVVRG